MKTIAVIGTGIMGSGIASNFLKNNYKVIVWNRTKEHTNKLIQAGAILANSPSEATKEADIIIEVTANDKSSRNVWLGKEGILEASNKKKCFITCATLSHPWIDELSNICKEKDLTFFDMPMTGGRIGAEAGKLTLLVGGDSNKLKDIENDLKSISEKILYFGENGTGMKFKLILNTLQAIHIAGLGEALKMAKEGNLDITKVGNALAERPGGIITNLAWRDYQVTPNPINFSVEWITKDLSYAKDLAKQVHTPLLDEVLERYRDATKKNFNQEDWTIINKL